VLLVGGWVYADPWFQDLQDLYQYTLGIQQFPTKRLAENCVSQPAQDFILNLMKPDPQHRLSVKSATADQWITDQFQAHNEAVIQISRICRMTAHPIRLVGTAQKPHPLRIAAVFLSTGADLITFKRQRMSDSRWTAADEWNR
jgi:serine/threonine protein kinase